ncbi:Bleomycin resistance protein [Staphylococcus aureus]|nr:Bleomycin resistance protein [Staphylococcus aureus]
MRMLQSIPALPVGDIKKSIGFYCDKLGFTLVHHEDGFAVLMCNEVRIHLWEASDEGWRSRSNDSGFVQVRSRLLLVLLVAALK